MDKKSLEKWANGIAGRHIGRMNPDMWGGVGERPENLDCRIATYPVSKDTELDISFELEPDGWTHCCELRDAITVDLLEIFHGYGIDSFQNLSDTIQDICKGEM